MATDKYCAADGCAATNILARGFCPKHYYRHKKRGTTELPPPATRLCEVGACFGKATRKGLCGKHYSRKLTKGDTSDPVKERRACAVDGCTRPHKGGGYCGLHWNRVKLHGDPSIGSREAWELNAGDATCRRCGKAFRKHASGQDLCSERCRKRERAGLGMASCAVCAKSFDPYNGAVTCSPGCKREKRREECRAHKARVRATPTGLRAQIEANKRYTRKRVRRDPSFRMGLWMRTTLARVLKGRLKTGKTVDLLGYTGAELATHIERQFTKGMAWSNYGEWHVDHIVPIADYMRRSEYSPAVVNALPNLRPMWSKDNIRKGAKVQSLL